MKAFNVLSLVGAVLTGYRAVTLLWAAEPVLSIGVAGITCLAILYLIGERQ